METLTFVPAAEFDRARRLNASAADRTALFATLARINTLSAIVRAGSGHIGSSFSSLDIVSWLYLTEMRTPGANTADHDVYFSSKGHDAPGLYAALCGLGLLPAESIRTLRRIGGLPGHPDVATPNIPANTGSLGMGISKAKGMVRANRLEGRKPRIFVLTGDGELQEGQIWESLVSAANEKLGEITVIVDHNKVQSDYPVARTSDLGDLVAKFTAFGWAVRRCDGHNLEQLQENLAALHREADKPKILIADTIKGRGVSFMEHTATPPGALYAFHSGAPSAEHYAKGIVELLGRANSMLAGHHVRPLTVETEQWQRPTPPQEPQRLIGAYSRAIVEQASLNPKIVALDADLVLDTGLIPFRDRFPDRFFECGIAEMDMVSQAGGLALRGFVPMVHSFACFLSTRPNEQIYANVTERKKTIYVGSLAGLIPSGPGHSHQSVRDIAILANMPGMLAMEPSCEAEVAQAVDYCVNRTEQSCYLRLVSVPYRIPFTLPADYKMELGRGVRLTQGNNAAIIGYGPILLSEAVKAADSLRDAGLSVRVINLPWLNRVDTDWLRGELAGVNNVFTLDNHYLYGGQGEFVTAAMARGGLANGRRIANYGLEDIPPCGLNAEALAAVGLDAEGIARRVRSFLAN